MSLEEYMKQYSPKSHKKFIKELPPNLKGRVGALMAVQEEHREIATELEKEQKALLKKYEALYTPLFEERQKVVNGEVEVTEEMVKAGKAYMEQKAKEDLDEEELNEFKEVPLPAMCKAEDIKKGIPEFWMECLENNPAMEGLMAVQDWDRPILKHLTNITCETDDDGFTLSFHFSENEFFTNKVLTKTTLLETSPGSGDEPSLAGFKCATIEWKDPSKNVMFKTKTVKKKKTRTQEQVPQESIFSFFTEIEDFEEDGMAIEMHMEVAGLLKDHIIPRAVESYCGEMFNDDDDDEEDEEDEDDDEDSEDAPPAKGKKGKKAGGDDKPKEECKQQ